MTGVSIQQVSAMSRWYKHLIHHNYHEQICARVKLARHPCATIYFRTVHGGSCPRLARPIVDSNISRCISSSSSYCSSSSSRLLLQQQQQQQVVAAAVMQTGPAQHGTICELTRPVTLALFTLNCPRCATSASITSLLMFVP